YRVGFAYLIASFLSLAVSAILGAFGGPFRAVLFSAAIFFLYPIFRHIQRNHRVYTLTSSVLEIRYGVLRRTVRTIPLRSVQDVTTSASLFKRLLGIGDVVIDSQASPGRIPLRNIRNPREFANLILSQLHRWDVESDLASEQRGDPSAGAF
ncbi:MAG: PH domain-containing protein, partial [Acidobacteriota bacterium]